MAGDEALRAGVRSHLGDRLVHDIAVGITHQEPNAMATTAVFFAPDQMRKRSQDWGRDGLDQRFGEAWRRFATTVADWVDVQERSGPTALREAWTEVHGGHTPPRIGHVIAL